ncbi:MAG: hypothetical protein RQ864_02005 [Lutibacter sp.]|nr:hypothetical protein [Lutibacter sp.]MDT8416559.1 hypothetical protein [Lutibacter sp.]
MDSKFKIDGQISFDSQMHKIHSEELGFKTPEDYFSKSKMEILEKVSNQKEESFNIFSRKRIVWSAAATIAIIVALTVFKPNAIPSMDKIPAIVSDTIDNLKTNGLAQNELEENDILITSLFISDNEIDEFVDDYVLEELVYEEVMANNN